MISSRFFCSETAGCRLKKAGGFTLYEFAVVVAIIGVLGGMLLNRIVFYQEQAETAQVLQMVGALRSALQMRVAELYVSSRQNEVGGLAGENPMNWLAEKPGNYMGEYANGVPPDVTPGSWYFSKNEGKLIYLLSSTKNFQGSRPNMLKFKVKFASDVEEMSSRSAGATVGVVFAQVND